MLADIANTIREQNGTETSYKPGEMAAADMAVIDTADTPGYLMAG